MSVYVNGYTREDDFALDVTVLGGPSGCFWLHDSGEMARLQEFVELNGENSLTMILGTGVQDTAVQACLLEIADEAGLCPMIIEPREAVTA